MAQQQQSQWQQMSLAEKADVLSNLALFPAMTILPFLRRRIGYRFLNPTYYQIMVLLLWLLAAFSAVGDPASAAPLLLFGLVVLIVASVERWMQWKEIKSGVRWHTYSRGIPWLCYFFPLRETVVKRFIDPALAAVIGIVLALLFHWLGYFIVFSAICLMIFESADYQRSINRMLDQLDAQVESEIVAENVEYYGQGGQAGERPVEQTAGIPTGADPDLASVIARRQAQQPVSGQVMQLPPQDMTGWSTQPPPDNLAF
jgi:hypothetical protein